MGRKTAALLLLLCLTAALPRAACADLEGDAELREHIRSLCETYQVPEALALAVIQQESGWDGAAVNYDGTCFGLMQIHQVNFPALRDKLGLTDLLDPRQNAEAGICMLSEYLEKYLDYQMALMCYNCGETAARRLWEQGCYSTAYSRSVLAAMERLEWEALQEARDRRYLQTRETPLL